MDKNKRKTTAYDMIYLIGCVINGRGPDAARVSQMDMTCLFSEAKRHSLCAIVSCALKTAGIADENFKQAGSKAARKNVLINTERAAVLNELENAGIWYMPLKGVYLQDHYPKKYMREMSDNDILFDSSYADKVKEIMQKRGFKAEEFGMGYDDVYKKQPVYNFEMHRMLYNKASNQVFCDYYSNVKERLLKDEDNNFGYHFSDEDFYIYICSHEFVHYKRAGTGLRSLLDKYLFLRSLGEKLDLEYIRRETEKLGIAEYDEKSRRLAEKIFSPDFADAPLDADMEKELDYYIFSGTYGNTGNFIENATGMYGRKYKGKADYILKRIFIPSDVIKEKYPFFYKHKLLYPFVYIYRLWHGLAVNGKRTFNELKLLFGKKH